MERRSVERFITGTIATIAGLICRVMFDEIFFRIYEGNYIEVFVALLLILSIILGIALMSKVMPFGIKIVGSAFLGIGTGGATVNAIVSCCLVCNINQSTINACQWISFVLLFICSGAMGTRKVEEI